MEIYCQHIYFIRNIKEMSLGRRVIIPDGILDLYKEMKSTGNRVNKIQIFLFLIALKDNNKKSCNIVYFYTYLLKGVTT